MNTVVRINNVDMPQKLVRSSQAVTLSDRKLSRTLRGKGILYEKPKVVLEFDLVFNLLTSSELNTVITNVNTGLANVISFRALDGSTYNVITDSVSVSYISYSASGALYNVQLKLKGVPA